MESFGSSNLVKCVFVHLENDVYNQGFKKNFVSFYLGYVPLTVLLTTVLPLSIHHNWFLFIES